MRTFVLVGVAVLVGVGGAIALGALRPDLVVHQTAVAPAPIPDTTDASVVWTGAEFLVWGGGSGSSVDNRVHAAGAAYDPATDGWRSLAAAPIEARERHVAVWTGSEMLVWGGTRRHFGVGDLLDGARYDPVADSWRTMTPAPTGTDRSGGQAVVVDGRVVIGAGYGPTGAEGRVLLVYDLDADDWTAVPLGRTVVHVLRVGDQVALLTQSWDEAAGVFELRVERFDPTTGALDLDGWFEVDASPDGAGLLEHDGELTLVVSPFHDGATLYRVDPDDPDLALTADRTVDLPAPVDLVSDSWLGPVLHDGSRRMLFDPTHGPIAGIDLATGAVARSGPLDGIASCLTAGSHAVAGTRVFVWGTPNCLFRPGAPKGSALVEVTWDTTTP